MACGYTDIWNRSKTNKNRSDFFIAPVILNKSYIILRQILSEE
jgi:hypothetical protein